MVAASCLFPILFGMNRPIMPAISPENAVRAEDLRPYTPEWLDALSEAERQSPKVREFYRGMHEGLACM
jgi:hypothetical protein